MNELIIKVREQNTNTILDAIIQMSSDPLSGLSMTTEERMVRAALIEVYAEREGTEAADTLMDCLGM